MTRLFIAIATTSIGCTEEKTANCETPSWTNVSLNSESSWYGEVVGAWGNEPGKMHLVGVSGQHLIGGGEDWQVLSDEGSSPEFKSLWGAAENDLFAITVENEIWRFDGSNWNPEFTGVESGALLAIHGSSADNVYAVGRDASSASGIAYRRNASGWEAISPPAGYAFRSVFSQAQDDVWLVGDNGYTAHYNGTDWTLHDSTTERDLNTIWVMGSNRAFAAGGDWVPYTDDGQGIILSFNGSAWSVDKADTWTVFDAMWGSGDDDVWAVGDVPDEEDPDGRIWHYDGLDWQEHDRIWNAPNAIWGTGPQDVYAVGFGGNADHNLHHYGCRQPQTNTE